MNRRGRIDRFDLFSGVAAAIAGVVMLALGASVGWSGVILGDGIAVLVALWLINHRNRVGGAHRRHVGNSAKIFFAIAVALILGLAGVVGVSSASATTVSPMIDPGTLGGIHGEGHAVNGSFVLDSSSIPGDAEVHAFAYDVAASNRGTSPTYVVHVSYRR